MTVRYEYGDMWSAYDEADLVLVTTNCTIRRDGQLVMGRGAAKQAKERFPQVPVAYGKAISELDHPSYGIMTPQDVGLDNCKVGIFQVKMHFRNQADLSLIRLSCLGLRERVRTKQITGTIHMNYPGIGNGGLPVSKVSAILDAFLPKNPLYKVTITIWRYAKEEPDD